MQKKSRSYDKMGKSNIFKNKMIIKLDDLGLT